MPALRVSAFFDRLEGRVHRDFRFTHWFKQIPDFAVKTTENKMRKNRLQVASGCKQQREKHLPFPPCDTDRTQTCNLLIRSQMLYSIKLRCRIAGANIWQR